MESEAGQAEQQRGRETGLVLHPEARAPVGPEGRARAKPGPICLPFLHQPAQPPFPQENYGK